VAASDWQSAPSQIEQAGCAFTIWRPLYLAAALYALWQLTPEGQCDPITADHLSGDRSLRVPAALAAGREVQPPSIDLAAAITCMTQDVPQTDGQFAPLQRYPFSQPPFIYAASIAAGPLVGMLLARTGG
jgi:hypothetical protein